MGRVIHFELPVDDSERAKSFYSDIFDWDISSYGDLRYWPATTGAEDEPGINGALTGAESMAPMGPRSVHIIIQVDDLDTTVQAALERGGNLAQARQTIPGVGFVAYITDSEGNRIGLLEEDENAALTA